MVDQVSQWRGRHHEPAVNPAPALSTQQHPAAKASRNSVPKRFIQVDPAADGGASTSDWLIMAGVTPLSPIR
jgi:hypothetical protein